MKMLAGSVFFVLVAAASGCGDPSCEDAVGAAMNRLGMGGARYGADRAQVVSMCKDKKWSGKKRACFAEASSEAAVLKCSKMDNEPKQKEEAAASPRAPDLVPGTAPGTVAP